MSRGWAFASVSPGGFDLVLTTVERSTRLSRFSNIGRMAWSKIRRTRSRCSSVFFIFILIFDGPRVVEMPMTAAPHPIRRWLGLSFQLRIPAAFHPSLVPIAN
jgi:hypothetical protein